MRSLRMHDTHAASGAHAPASSDTMTRARVSQHAWRTLAALALSSTLGTATLDAQTRTGATTRPTTARPVPGSGYLTVNGLRMYYESQGTGRPLVLLHGAFMTNRMNWSKLQPLLAKGRRIIAIEQQGHGHTADIARPLTYEQMADDTAELLRQLGVTSADVVGYSMGGGIGLALAMRHPALVRKLVNISGTSYSPEGIYPEVLKAEAALKPEDLKSTPMYAEYVKVAPDPKAWNALVTKVRDFDLAWTGWTSEAVSAVKTPTLLMLGDADIIPPEHAAEMFRLLGGGVPIDLRPNTPLPRARLAIIPGASHVTIIERTSLLAPMIIEFLDAPTTGGTR